MHTDRRNPTLKRYQLRRPERSGPLNSYPVGTAPETAKIPRLQPIGVVRAAGSSSGIQGLILPSKAAGPLMAVALPPEPPLTPLPPAPPVASKVGLIAKRREGRQVKYAGAAKKAPPAPEGEDKAFSP